MKSATRLTTLGIVVIAIPGFMLLAACASQFNPPPPGARMPSRAEVLDAAQNFYIAGPERPPKDTQDLSYPAGHSVSNDSAPSNITIATMRPLPVPVPLPFRFLARITSNRDYPPMGIKQGLNYVWRDWMDRAWITPVTGPDRQLEDVPGYVFPRPFIHETSLFRVQTNSVSFLVCLDDCPSGHCGMF